IKVGVRGLFSGTITRWRDQLQLTHPDYLLLPDTVSGTNAQTDELGAADRDRKSTRLNSSHVSISYAVVCLKKKQQLEMVSTDNDPQSDKKNQDFIFQIPHHAVIYFEKEIDTIKLEEAYA